MSMTIAHAARAADVGVETIRFYERRGLIKQPPKPRGGGYRTYDDAVVERIRFIRQAQELGFSLREIGELLSLRADPRADCGDVRQQAVQKRSEVDRKIGQLHHIRSALDELIATCPGGGALRACTILEAMAGKPEKKPSDVATTVRQRASKTRRERHSAKGQSMRTAKFGINGMHCDGCARTIEALVATEPGVRKATVSFKTREARILFEPEVVSEDRLAKTIVNAGYTVAETRP